MQKTLVDIYIGSVSAKKPPMHTSLADISFGEDAV